MNSFGDGEFPPLCIQAYLVLADSHKLVMKYEMTVHQINLDGPALTDKKTYEFGVWRSYFCVLRGH